MSFVAESPRVRSGNEFFSFCSGSLQHARIAGVNVWRLHPVCCSQPQPIRPLLTVPHSSSPLQTETDPRSRRRGATFSPMQHSTGSLIHARRLRFMKWIQALGLQDSRAFEILSRAQHFRLISCFASRHRHANYSDAGDKDAHGGGGSTRRSST